MFRRPILGFSASLFAALGLGIACPASAQAPPFPVPEETLPEGFALPDRSLYEQGRFVYERYCVVCHGARGDGQGEMAVDLAPKPRKFRSALFKYRSTPWGKLPTDADLLRTVRGGRSGTAMGMFTALSEEEQRAVVEYVKSFSRKWRHAENYAPPIELPAEPLWLLNASERAGHAAAGRATFESTCAACHGLSGDGKGPAAAALKDDAGQPATPADLRLPHLRSGDEPIDIYRVLATGLNGTPMVSFADTLSASQKWDVVAYILTLRRGGVAR